MLSASPSRMTLGLVALPLARSLSGDRRGMPKVRRFVAQKAGLSDADIKELNIPR